MLRSPQQDATAQLDVSQSTSPRPACRGLQESVAVAWRCVDANNRRDLGALRALSDPDLELDWSSSRWLDAGVYRGVDAVLRFYADYFDAFEKLVLEPDCFMSVGQSVLIPNIARVRGRHGIEVVARSTLTVTVSNGKVTRIHLAQERLACAAACQRTAARFRRDSLLP